MALIFRACGVELRTKTDSPGLIRFFDAIILGGSLVPAWGIGLVAGNVLVGLPLDASGNLVGSWLFFLNPFALVASLVSVAAFVLHGLLYVSLKVEAKDRPIYVGKAKIAFWAFAGLVAVSAILSPFVLAARFGAAKSLIVFWVFVGLFAVGYSGVFSDLRAGRHGGAFAASAIGLASIVGMSASLLFPVLIPSRLGAANDLSIGNAASPDATLKVILIMACIAVPLIVVYTAIAYRSFRGVAREADK
jgi:cytochrome d ubiquinol oxidase subunit II